MVMIMSRFLGSTNSMPWSLFNVGDSLMLLRTNISLKSIEVEEVNKTKDIENMIGLKLKINKVFPCERK